MESALYCSIEVIEDIIWMKRYYLFQTTCSLVNYSASSPFADLVTEVLK